MFYKDKSRIDGKQPHCKECHNIITIKWRKNNPDKYDKTSSCNPKNNKKQAHKHKIRSRKYRYEMTDYYIRDVITMNNNLKHEDISDDLVKLWRINLKLKRALKLTAIK